MTARSGLSREDAERVEKLRQELVRGYLLLSSKSERIVADGSSHFIHLDAPAVVIEAVKKTLESIATE
jgi:pimeloyl-ACP methyl ester carboxylesterase